MSNIHFIEREFLMRGIFQVLPSKYHKRGENSCWMIYVNITFRERTRVADK